METGRRPNLVEIVGGSGTNKVLNWAWDRAHFAFLSHQMLPAEDEGPASRRVELVRLSNAFRP